MIDKLRRLFTSRYEDLPSPLVRVSCKLTYREYGVKDLQGETVWFSDDSSRYSLSEALWYFDSFNEGDAVLMRRLVSPGREVDHVRFRPRGCGW